MTDVRDFIRNVRQAEVGITWESLDVYARLGKAFEHLARQYEEEGVMSEPTMKEKECQQQTAEFDAARAKLDVAQAKSELAWAKYSVAGVEYKEARATSDAAWVTFYDAKTEYDAAAKELDAANAEYKRALANCQEPQHGQG